MTPYFNKILSAIPVISSITPDKGCDQVSKAIVCQHPPIIQSITPASGHFAQSVWKSAALSFFGRIQDGLNRDLQKKMKKMSDWYFQKRHSWTSAFINN